MHMQLSRHPTIGTTLFIASALALVLGTQAAMAQPYGPYRDEPGYDNRGETVEVIAPRYPYRTESLLPYPPPYDVEYPGPGFVRQCTSWLAPEHRPSGTVIVPHSRCWWERG